MATYGDKMRGLMNGLFPSQEEREPPQLAFLRREDSFCVVFFSPAAPAQMRALLERCDYEVLSQETMTGPFAEIYDRLKAIEGPRRNRVLKGFYTVAGWTVLLDPEMVVATNSGALAEFCKEKGLRALSATWERFSQSVIVSEVGPDGVRRQMSWVAGVAQQPDVQPWPEIAASPNPAGIRGAFKAAGVPIEAAFAEIEATVLKLEE